MANIFRLKAWVRYDGKGRLVGGGPILQESKPKNGDWVEIPFYEYCCQTVLTTTTSTTLLPVYTYFVGFDSEAGSNACDNPTSSFNVYSADSILIINSFVYPNPDLTGSLTDGYIAFGDRYYEIIGNQVIDIRSCLPPYIYGGPDLVFDFSQVGTYSNSGTTIADLSGNSNDGVFSTGTGNGSPYTVTGYSTNGYLNLPGTSAELSVRLPDSLKPTGTVPFTYIVYMQPNGYGYIPNYPGIISNELYNGVSGEGFVWAISPLISPNDIYASRDNTYVATKPFSGGAGLGVWSVYAIKFDGTSTTLYQYYNGVMYTTNGGANAIPVTSYPSWGLFLGLRYNNWINAKFNYVAMYNTALSDLEIENIANTLSQRIIP